MTLSTLSLAAYGGQSAIREQLVGRAVAIEAWILVFWLCASEPMA